MRLLLLFFIPVLCLADMKPEGMMEAAAIECSNLGVEAGAIQMIRGDGNPSLNEILAHLNDLLVEEYGHSQPLYLMRVKEVGRWVYHQYSADFDPSLAGNTYTILCAEKTIAQIKSKFPELYERKAWESIF